LILEDLARDRRSSSTDVNRQIGAEISAKTIKRALDGLVTGRNTITVGHTICWVK
jgi:ATP-dependent DNA helicase RecG